MIEVSSGVNFNQGGFNFIEDAFRITSDGQLCIAEKDCLGNFIPVLRIRNQAFWNDMDFKVMSEKLSK